MPRASLAVGVVAAAAAAAIIRPAAAAAVLEDHSLSWAAAGLTDDLANGHESALPTPLLSALAQAIGQVRHEVADASQERYKFGKKNTWWMPLTGPDAAPPRSAIEAAIHRLFALDFAARPSLIVGAEWWFQEGGAASDIGYHYDKDEASASEEMTMRFPEVSTVTYLTDVGAPTLILNQTTPDGNAEVPPTPTGGLLVHPAPNKHLVFRGNLHHGVTGELSRWAHGGEATADDARSTTAAGQRVTFLVNWWRRMPKPPNCVPFGDERWRRTGLWLDGGQVAALMGGGGGGGGAEDASRPMEWLPLPLDATEARHVAITLPVTDLIFFRFPPPPKMRKGNWVLRWEGATAAIGPITRLDLHHRRSLDALFNDPRPKLFLVFPTKGAPNWQGALPKWTSRLLDDFAPALRFVLVDPTDASADFMRQFGIKRADAPTVVIHDNHRGADAKYRLTKDARTLRRAAVTAFVEDFLRGRLARLTKDEL